MESKQIEEEREKISKTLNERLETHDESRMTAQEKLHEICEGLRTQVEKLFEKINSELEEKFNSEDSRLQSAYEDLQMDGETSKMIQKAKAKLFVMQSYELVERNLGDVEPANKKMKTEGGGNEEPFDLSSLCELKTERHVVPEMVELMRPTNLRVSGTNKGPITFQFTCLGPDEMRVLSENGAENHIKYKCLLTKRGENESTEYDLEKIGDDCFNVLLMSLDKKSTYGVRVKIILWDKECEWSDEAIIPDGTETEAQKPSASGLNPEKLEEERENIKQILSEHIEIHDESRRAAQEKLHEICEELRAQVDKLGEKINNELEEKFTTEDNRHQTVLSELHSVDAGEALKMIQKAKTVLLVEQTYDVVERNSDKKESGQKSRILSMYELKTEIKVSSDIFKEKKLANVVPSFTEKGELSLSFTFFDEDEVEALKDVDLPFEVEVKMWERDQNEEYTSRTLTTKIILGEPVCFRSTFTAITTYCLKMRIVHQGVSTQWSDDVEFTTPEFKCCAWKECPDNVDGNRKYSVDAKNPRIAGRIGGGLCTIIGNTSIPLNKVTLWSIKILKSKWNNGDGILIGVAPSNINQNTDNYDKCGWYFHCYYSKLCSGPPHNYWDKEYGPRKGKGEYVHEGGSIGVIMDTAKGELSFVLDGVDYDVAYEGIPLDKPLVPCVILREYGDSVEFII